MTKRENLARLVAWVDLQTKRDFAALAKSNSHTESSLLKVLVNAFLKKNPVIQEQAETEADSGNDAKFTFWTGTATKAELTKRAAARGLKPSVYMRSLVRSHLTNQPSFTDAELAELKEANRQLAAIGKNINQIAKALNTSLDNAHMARAQELEEVRQYVDHQRHVVTNLVRENMKAWRVEHGNKSE